MCPISINANLGGEGLQLSNGRRYEIVYLFGWRESPVYRKSTVLLVLLCVLRQLLEFFNNVYYAASFDAQSFYG